MLQKFVRRVEIGENNVKIYWNVDKAFYFNELTIKSNTEKSLAEAGDPLFKLKKNVRNFGSNSFTNGARGETPFYSAHILFAAFQVCGFFR